MESVFAQTTPFDEVILVDDGSTDDSRAVLEELRVAHPELKLIYKENGGQLSCFNVGFESSEADLFCFLDADDAYEPGYLEAVRTAFENNPAVDFVIGNNLHVRDGQVVSGAVEPDFDYGYTLVLALTLQKCVGGPTSCLSIRRNVLEQVLPLPFTDQWRTLADNPLLLCSSLVGARKYFMGAPLVRYRVHETNWYYGRSRPPLADYERRVALNRMIEHMVRRVGYGPGLESLAHREFRTCEKPTRGWFRSYRRAVLRSRLPLTRKLRMLASMAAHFYFGASWG